MGFFKDFSKKTQQLAAQQQPVMQTYDSVFSLSTNPYVRVQYDHGGLNKVPRSGYVPNEYTGRSKMTYGGMNQRNTTNVSRMDQQMMGTMQNQMNTGGNGGMMYDSNRMKKAVGGSVDIYAMEDACNKMAGYNKSLPKNR